jgi:cold-inducible RNA-binding protein
VGEVVGVTVPTDRDTGRPRGFAFVEFASDEAAAAVLSRFDRHELNGRALRIDQATERAAGGGGASRPGGFTDRPPPPRSRPKGSRRNLRARKRGF